MADVLPAYQPPAPSWSSQLGTRLVPGSFSQEKINIKNYLTLNNWQLAVIVGIALSGTAALVTTYNSISGISKETSDCENSDSLKKKYNVQFIVTLVLSILAVVLGILLAWLFRNATNQRRILTLGITGVGILGIIYAITIKLKSVQNKFKLGISWGTFVLFIILGFAVSGGATGTVIETTPV